MIVRSGYVMTAILKSNCIGTTKSSMVGCWQATKWHTVPNMVFHSHSTLCFNKLEVDLKVVLAYTLTYQTKAQMKGHGAWGLNKQLLFNFNLSFWFQLRVTETHVWTQRETTEKGAPLKELIAFGINRVKFSCQVIDVLLKDLKFYSCNKR